MQLLFWRKRKKQELDEIERTAAKTHRENISTIVQSRKNVDKLKQVLEKNNIVIELASAIGHR